MTPKSFWTILVKIFGLYFIWITAGLLPQLISLLPLANHENFDSFMVFFLVFVWGIIGVFYFFLIRYCLVKTDWVIEKLHLDRGFDEEKFELNIHRSTVLSIAVIVIGGVMFATELPQLLYSIFTYLQRADQYKGFTDNPRSPWIVFDTFKVVIGYFMITESRLIVNFIECRRKIPAGDIAE